MSSTQTTVSPEWLRKNLDNPQVKIIDCRFRLGEVDWGFTQYSHSHIPNSYYLNLDRDLSGTVETHGGRHPLPNSQQLAQKLTRIGIKKDRTTIVVYDDARFAFASRLWWSIRYLGHSRVFILDGGWQQWQDLGYPTDNLLPSYDDSGDFTPVIQTDLVVDIDRLKQYANSSSAIIIDARSHDRYCGKVEPIDPVAGSIPQAKNVFWQQMSTETGQLKSRAELESIWYPYRNYSPIIMYCGSGVTACVNILALTTIGLTQSKLYVGGWSDYCSYL